jgi:hypothetical protein
MPAWVRVRDRSTKHEYDLPAGAVAAYGDAVEVHFPVGSTRS